MNYLLLPMFLQSPNSQGSNMQSPHHKYSYMFYMFLFHFFLNKQLQPSIMMTLKFFFVMTSRENVMEFSSSTAKLSNGGLFLQMFFKLFSNLFHFSIEHAAFSINLKSQHLKSQHLKSTHTHTTHLMLMLMLLHNVYQVA